MAEEAGMQVQDQANADPSRDAKSDLVSENEVGRAVAADARSEYEKSRAVVVTGAGLCEAGGAPVDFRPRLNNALEQELFARARRKSRISEWSVRSFSGEDFAGQPRSPLINPHLRAQELAFSQALRSAGLLRKIGRKQSRRVGVIYVDFYGNTSSLERELSSRELYYLDVYPTYLLQNHNITGFSLKTRGERNGAAEGLDVAQTLIRSGELDAVILGGVFPCYSYLFLSEALEDAAWLKARGLREREGACELCERSIFVVLEAAGVAAVRGQPARYGVEDPQFYQLPAPAGAGSALTQFWSARWSAGDFKFDSGLRRNPAVSFGGSYRAAAIDAEYAALSDAYSGTALADLSADGDSGQLNALKPFCREPAGDAEANVGTAWDSDREQAALIHTWDRCGRGAETWIRRMPEAGPDRKIEVQRKD